MTTIRNPTLHFITLNDNDIKVTNAVVDQFCYLESVENEMNRSKLSQHNCCCQIISD